MIFRIAFDALEGNKTRTALTMLGVIIGVAAVITMIALGRGAQSAIEAQVRSTGTNMIVVNAGNVTTGGVRQGQGAASTLVPEDADAIRQLPGVQFATAGVNMRLQVVAGSQNWLTRIEGADVDFPDIRAWPLRHGTFFTSQDVRSLGNVAVLGSVVSETLFGLDTDPTGQIIRLKNQPFRVVGVLTSKGVAAMGQDPDDTIVVPYTTAQKKLLGIAYIQSITVSAASATGVPQVAAEITDLLRVRHRLVVGDPDDFMVRTLEEMASLRTESTQTMTMLLAGIAAVSLLVGGIGIMNIMLVSVAERTREIGLRMAVGAKGRDVLLQFLVEAATISLIGGVLGIALGFGLSRAFTSLLGWPTTFSPEAVALAFGFSAFVGIFFGFYPARRAASLDPIEALRYE
ncbi:MAG: ABC transporter permease [Acidobacteriia bacterium]|nr:ABC transporter permease [Terriglobia bacterium]